MSLRLRPTFQSDGRVQGSVGWRAVEGGAEDRGSCFKEIAFERADPPESQALSTGSTSVNQDPSSP